MALAESVLWTGLGIAALATAWRAARAWIRLERREYRRLLALALGTGSDLSLHLKANQVILRDAQDAAARAARRLPTAGNPHRVGTREFVLWEAEYQRVFTDLTEERLHAPRRPRSSG